VSTDRRSLTERLHDRRFVSLDNPDGVAGRETVFHYRVQGSTIVGTYAGGPIRAGHLIGRATSDEGIELLYQCLTTDDALLAGRSRGTLSLDERALLHIHFEWAWLTGDQHGGP
jgi:hypothetical protein